MAAQHNLGPQFTENNQATPIDAAIDSYPQRIRTDSGGAAPYDAGSMAEIYEPRVRQLMDLQSQGFTHARWGHNPETKTNQWYGHTPESPEVSGG